MTPQHPKANAGAERCRQCEECKNHQFCMHGDSKHTCQPPSRKAGILMPDGNGEVRDIDTAPFNS